MNRNVLITGATSGIGLACANIRLVSDGTSGITNALRTDNGQHDLYDLQGRKVSTVDSQLRKGVYVKDGKKVTVK